MTVVAIHQPPYFPWFGLIDKIARADVFVVLDNVQYNRRAFQHRTLYSTEAGARYLSLDVLNRGTQTSGLTIAEVELADPTTPRKHFETLRHRYGRRPGWRKLEAALSAILLSPPGRLVDLSLATLRLTLEQFELAPRILMASELNGAGTKSELMRSLTHACGGQTYLSGAGAGSYMDEDSFDAAGIHVEWQQFVHPVFHQSHSGEFVPGCFALEWMLEEPDQAASLFRKHVRSTGLTPPRCVAKVDHELE